MLFPSWQYPMLRSFRSMLPRLLVLAGAVALAGCDSNESPLAPANEPAPSDAAAPADAWRPRMPWRRSPRHESPSLRTPACLATST